MAPKKTKEMWLNNLKLFGYGFVLLWISMALLSAGYKWGILVAFIGWLGGGNLLIFTIWATRCPFCNRQLVMRNFFYSNPFWAPSHCPGCHKELP